MLIFHPFLGQQEHTKSFNIADISTINDINVDQFIIVYQYKHNRKNQKIYRVSMGFVDPLGALVLLLPFPAAHVFPDAGVLAQIGAGRRGGFRRNL